ncbi:MAG TPA: hypothetical protein VLF93_00270 [Candidatus Saccharimonadales bacterium]|nr:hypothetical protein [Candidatus Saccharimonadales bacterium]
MIFRTLSKKADIFVISKRRHLLGWHYKPLTKLQTTGLALIGALLVFNTIMLLPTNQAQPSVKEAENANMYGWGNNSQDNYTNQSRDSYVHTPVNFAPFPSNNVTMSSPPTVISPEPPISPVPDTTLVVDNTTQNQQFQPVQPIQQNGQNIPAISAQIIATQQQISGFMQRCALNARLMANQIIQLKNQQKQLQNQLDALNNQQQPNFDTSTPQGQQQQQAWQQRQQQKQQQLQQQIDALGNSIDNAQNNMNNASDQCHQNVSQLEQNRETLEGNLDDAFNNAMNIQIPDPQ